MPNVKEKTILLQQHQQLLQTLPRKEESGTTSVSFRKLLTHGTVGKAGGGEMNRQDTKRSYWDMVHSCNSSGCVLQSTPKTAKHYNVDATRLGLFSFGIVRYVQMFTALSSICSLQKKENKTEIHALVNRRKILDLSQGSP